MRLEFTPCGLRDCWVDLIIEGGEGNRVGLESRRVRLGLYTHDAKSELQSIEKLNGMLVRINATPKAADG